MSATRWSPAGTEQEGLQGGEEQAPIPPQKGFEQGIGVGGAAASSLGGLVVEQQQGEEPHEHTGSRALGLDKETGDEELPALSSTRREGARKVAHDRGLEQLRTEEGRPGNAAGPEVVLEAEGEGRRERRGKGGKRRVRGEESEGAGREGQGREDGSKVLVLGFGT